jgi:uncharacterized protein
MKNRFKEIKVYLLVTILFTWLFWILSMYLAIKNHTFIPLDDRIANVINNGFHNNNQILVTFLFLVGTLGPLVGYFFVKKEYNIDLVIKVNKIDYKYLLLVTLFPIILFSLGLIIPFLLDKVRFEYFYSFLMFINVLLIQVLLSTISIISWFGFVFPYFEKKYKLIRASYIVGLLWSIWMLPIIIYISYQYGTLVTFYNVFGLLTMTTALSLLLAWLYKKTKNIILVIFAYAWFKTMLMSFSNSSHDLVLPILFTILGLWVVNYCLITKKIKGE